MYCTIFPGQGSYCIGMGKDIYENFKSSKHVFDSADEILGYSISKIIFNGPNEELTQSRHIQVAIFLTSIALFCALEEASNKKAKDISTCLLGHSLGQYTALYIAKCLPFHDAIKLVHARSIAMQKTCEKAKGKMLACINVPFNILENIIAEAKSLGIIDIANYNSKSQIILSGEENAILRAKELLQARSLRFIELNVAGAFHTKLMQEAADEFEQYIKSVQFAKPNIDVIDNCSATNIKNHDNLPEILKAHITSPVLWDQSISSFINLCQTQRKEPTFLEIGPKTVLSTMLKKDYPNVTAHSICTASDVENFAKSYLI